MLRFSKTALGARVLAAFPTPILPASFKLEHRPADGRGAVEIRCRPPLPPVVAHESGGFNPRAIPEAVELDPCPDGLCPLTLSEYALIESGRESVLINGLLSPIDRRVLELFEVSPHYPLQVDLLFQRSVQVPENLIA